MALDKSDDTTPPEAVGMPVQMASQRPPLSRDDSFLSPDDISRDPSIGPNTIHDGGDEKQLAVRDGEELFHDQTGSVLPEDRATEDDDAMRNVEDQFSTNSTPQDGNPKVPSLGDQLRDALQKSAWMPRDNLNLETSEPREFIPINMVEKIISDRSVRAEILSWSPRDEKLDEDSLTRMVHDIRCKHTIKDESRKDVSPADKSTHRVSRRKLFAILLLTDRPQTIKGLIEEEIYDFHLPFVSCPETRKMKRQSKKMNKQSKKMEVVLEDIKAFKHWTPQDHTLWTIYQWYMLAPYFSFSDKENPTAIIYKLEAMRPLPFVEIPGASDSSDDPAKGGFGVVRRFKVHEAHLAPGSHTSTDIAMKTLISDSPIAFDQEVEALQWVIRKRNPYAIRLLVAIEHGANKSLFFPWAEGNLLQFWKRITPRADTFWVRWMAKQFAGLASVIKLIHGPMKAAFGTTDPPAANGYLHRPEERQSTRYGRHGDVKPENILYFLGSENDDDTDHTIVGGPKGILKMSDFGLAAFHSKVSQEVRASRTGRSLTYRGPEHDRELVTAEADLWSFGCVLLEFLVWYQHGIEGVIRFGQNRLEEEKARDPESRYHEDKFFLQSSEPGEAMALKEAVIDEIEALRVGPKCSDFCNEALDLIENGLFQIDPSKRFTCTTVHDKLQTIYFRSIINPDYCTKSTSTSTVRQTKRATSRGSTKIHEAEGADTMEISKNTTTDEGKQAKTALATENTITSKGENMAPTTMLTNMTDGIERDETPTATSDNKAHTVELAETVTGPNNVQSGDVRQPEKTAAADPTVTKPGEKRQPRNVHDA